MPQYTRREIAKLTLAGLPSAGLLLRPGSALGSPSAKANSTWAGVEVGMNVPYSFGTRTTMTGEDVLEKCVQLNVSTVELRAQPIEKSLGLPANLVLGPAPVDYQAARARSGEVPGVSKGGGAASPGGSVSAKDSASAGSPKKGGPPQTAEQIAAYKAAVEQLHKWRLSAPMSKAKELRKKYEDSGVAIEIVKFDGLATLPDEELDYAFTLAKALGARAVSGELAIPSFKRLAEAAARNKMFVGLHGHVAVTPAIWEQGFSFGPYVGANVDIGHFMAGNNTSPLPFIKQYRDRITHIHVKDRKMHDGPNVPFGQGDTPIKEVLQTIRDNKWKIPAIIEFEIPLPPGADRTPELVKCVDYCKQCLLG
jgi:sugar phosphate isomerase/epimerase